MITLAHLSDVHLAPLPRVTARELMSKRLTGWLNWKLKRGRDMGSGSLGRLVEHLNAQGAEMTAVTGDLVNLALDAEFDRARRWLETLGLPQSVCAIPGNHDAYVKGGLEKTLAACGPYMNGERINEAPFPFVRRIGDVAIIGVSSAIATRPFVAAGKVGTQQRDRLGKLSKLLGDAGYFRIVLIHHPPHAELADSKRLGLWDAAEFRSVIEQNGAELILHGHSHISSINAIPGPNHEIPVVGVASASAAPGGHEDPGRYNLFRIEKVGADWSCNMREYGYQRIGDEITLRLQMRIY